MTLCDECGIILTDALGNRLQSAVFDSALPNKHRNDYTKNLIYAHCEKCHRKLTDPKKPK